MITVFILFGIAFIVFAKNFKQTNIYPLASLILPIVLYVLFVIEVQFSALKYFDSDEINYLYQIGYNLNLDRFFWFSLNRFLVKIDYGATVSIKLFNIPMLFFTLYMLWAIFFNDKSVFMVVFVLPYLALIATKDFRDVTILCFTVSVFYTFYKLRKRWLGVILLLFLFILRPFIGFIVIFLIVYDLFIKEILWNSISVSLVRPKFIIKTRFFKFLTITILIYFLFMSIPYVNNRIGSYWYYLTYYTSGEGYIKKQIARGAIQTGHYLTDYLVGGIRYAITPIPTSVLKRLFHGGTETWGILDDIIRVLNQSFYYLILFYVLVNLKYIYPKFKRSPPEQRLLIILLLCHLPLYTFYSFGIGHQRVKIPFQLAFFLLFIINKNIQNASIEK